MNKQSNIDIKLQNITLGSILTIPQKASSIIVFAHGSGSSRFSSRNNYVARILEKAGFATLLVDLLTEVEDQEYQQRFDIKLLTNRLIDITTWLKNYPTTKDLVVGYFGASTGAAAALDAAVNLKLQIASIVSRGGRPDLALYLEQVKAPTLLIVGGDDDIVIELNKKALERLDCQKELVIVPHATHLFEEPGALEKVAELSIQWFKKYLNT